MECSDYMMESKSWLAVKYNWEENGQRVYSLILHHCHPTLELKISEHTGWILVRDSGDMVGLLKLIRNITHNQDETKHADMSVVECDLELMLGFQEKYQSLDDFMRMFLAKCDTIKACGGGPGIHMGLYTIAVT